MKTYVNEKLVKVTAQYVQDWQGKIYTVCEGGTWVNGHGCGYPIADLERDLGHPDVPANRRGTLKEIEIKYVDQEEQRI